MEMVTPLHQVNIFKELWHYKKDFLMILKTKIVSEDYCQLFSKPDNASL
jgi:hypothetical protein